jgi:hypothetical protein
LQYFSLVVFLFVLEFLMSGMGFLFRGALSHSVSEELRVGIATHYTINPPSGLAIIWDHAQREVSSNNLFIIYNIAPIMY